MNDPLAALEASESPQLPSVQSIPPAPESAALAARVVELEGKLAEAEARREAQSERIKSLESPGLFGGKAKARAAELAKENEDLRAKLAKLEAEAEAGVEVLLPAVTQAETALALVTEEKENLTMALIQAQHQVGAAHKQLGEMEFERDERDSLLRDQEGRTQEAERRQRMAQEQLALVRASAIRSTDPGAGEPKKGVALTRLRLQAALGNMGAAVQLGGDYLDNTCAFCNASPACTKNRLLTWPHGKLVPRNEQEYLKLLVQEAQALGSDPFLVLEAWAAGMDGEEVMDNLKDGGYRRAKPEEPEELTGFAKRAAERLKRDTAERSIAHELRALRCKDCDQTLLWHKDDGRPKRSDDVCDLDQREVFERSKLKTVDELVLESISAEDVLSNDEPQTSKAELVEE
jgi:hypothetical protein